MLAVAARAEIPPSSNGIPPSSNGSHYCDVKGKDFGDSKSFEDFCNHPPA